MKHRPLKTRLGRDIINEARPLGTPEPRPDVDTRPLRVRKPQFPVPAFVPTASYVGTQKAVDTSIAREVDLPQSPITVTTFQEKQMTLTFTKLSKNGQNAFYAGAASVLRFALNAFPGKNAPQTIEVADGVFAPGKVAKVKMTKEERKAFNASKPKKTEAEKIAQAEAKIAARKAKLAGADSM